VVSSRLRLDSAAPQCGSARRSFNVAFALPYIFVGAGRQGCSREALVAGLAFNNRSISDQIKSSIELDIAHGPSDD